MQGKVFLSHKSAWTFSFTLISTQGASAGGLPSVVWGAGGAGDLQSVPGPDSRPPSALLPWWGHPGPESWSASAAATTGRVENLLHLSACETNTHYSYQTSNHFIHILYLHKTLTASVLYGLYHQWSVKLSLQYFPVVFFVCTTLTNLSMNILYIKLHFQYIFQVSYYGKLFFN